MKPTRSHFRQLTHPSLIPHSTIMADVAAPSFKKRTTKNIRKRPATPPPDDASSASEYTSDEDESGARIKRRKKEGVRVTATGPQRPQDLSKSTKYAADRSTTITALDDATKTSNWSVNDAAANATARPRPEPRAEDGDASGAYKGKANYSSHIQKNADAASRQAGPVKAPTNVRTITVTDFAPDVCKDYKQTGFCGFGDSCKFLHAREDYKQGWQLDKEWEKVGSKASSNSKGGKDGGKATEDMDEEEKMLEKIPFACIICKEAYKNPVVTKCGHYFCERCAMTRYMKEKKRTCANCGADTAGTFNVARKVKELLAKKRQREEERKAKAREAGDDVSSGDEDDE